MPRCRSWFPVQSSGHLELHEPGTCRACWRPCRNRVPSGVDRCDQCADALACHGWVRVRKSLAEQTSDRGVLEYLLSDLDSAVVGAAAARLTELDATGFPGSTGTVWIEER